MKQIEGKLFYRCQDIQSLPILNAEERNDAARAGFTVIGREIAVAVKAARMGQQQQAARCNCQGKANNMPNDTIVDAALRKQAMLHP